MLYLSKLVLQIAPLILWFVIFSFLLIFRYRIYKKHGSILLNIPVINKGKKFVWLALYFCVSLAIINFSQVIEFTRNNSADGILLALASIVLFLLPSRLSIMKKGVLYGLFYRSWEEMESYEWSDSDKMILTLSFLSQSGHIHKLSYMKIRIKPEVKEYLEPILQEKIPPNTEPVT